MFALNQGEVCTCPSRILVHEEAFMTKFMRDDEREQTIKWVTRCWKDTMNGGSGTPNDQYEKILFLF